MNTKHLNKKKGHVWQVFVGLCLLISCSFVLGQDFYQQQQQYKQLLYQQQRFINYLRGMGNFQVQWNPYDSRSELAKIYRQLQQYSKKQFAVVPGETGQIGQAHIGGLIILDISTTGKPTSALAFWFAHEWAHLALGHQPNIYFPQGRMRFKMIPTQDEDEADLFAGQFLAKYRYDLDEVIADLRSMPEYPFDHLHSKPETRIEIVKRGYNSTKSSDRTTSKRIPCQHRTVCSHPLHAYDALHVYDYDFLGRIFPCAHHLPCQHRLHPYDTLHQFDTINN